jgi:hypothetical protein
MFLFIEGFMMMIFLGILDTSQDSSFDREARKISAPAVMQTPTHRTPFLVTPPQQPIQARGNPLQENS